VSQCKALKKDLKRAPAYQSSCQQNGLCMWPSYCIDDFTTLPIPF